MLRKSLQIEKVPITVLPWDRRKCVWIANSVIIQCLIVYVGSVTILHCFWSPDECRFDFDKLARIMYLFDHSACGYKLRAATALSNIRLPNETQGLDIWPIKWQRALVTVSTRLSSKTRKYVFISISFWKSIGLERYSEGVWAVFIQLFPATLTRYIELSLAVHVLWNICAIMMNIIIRKNTDQRVLKLTLTSYFYYSIAVIIFDLSMAVVYIAHIQQSLTKGMVLRYSGWSVELKLKSYDDFAGWLPMIASIFWMRGIFVLMWNIYCCKIVNSIRWKIRKREVRIRLGNEVYTPIPDQKHLQPNDTSVLYYRTGENKPYVKSDVLSRVF